MKQLTIQQWFARAVAAGLMPEWENVWAIYTKSGWVLRDCQGGESYYIPVELSPISKSNTIQLRSNGKDLYSLEWRKPTEQDVGKMCWVKHYDRSIKILPIENVRIDNRVSFISSNSLYNIKDCLLADHGQIAPTESDFKRIYGE